MCRSCVYIGISHSCVCRKAWMCGQTKSRGTIEDLDKWCTGVVLGTRGVRGVRLERGGDWVNRGGGGLENTRGLRGRLAFGRTLAGLDTGVGQLNKRGGRVAKREERW